MRFLLAPLVAWTIAQAAKVILTSVRQRRINVRVLAETGGMPSSHSAIVMGLTTAVGKYSGLNSAAFAIALIFTFVVMYDAAGRLRELLGHTPFEVLVGAVIGLAVGLIV